MGYESSNITKKELSNALRALLKEKKLSKISINDITNKAHMNRNSFYYHFEDINGLLKWTFEQEVEKIVNSFNQTNIKKTIEDTISYVENNRFILNCVFDSFGREQLKHFFYSSAYQVIKSMIKYDNNENNNKYKTFVSNALTEMAGSTLLEYFRNEKKSFTKEETITYLTNIIESNVKLLEKL